MELPCIFNLSVLHVWFKTWMESPCMFFMSGSKLLDGIFLYVQFVSTSCLVQNISKSFEPDMKYWQLEHTGCFNPKFWARHEVLISWTYREIQSKSFQPDMKYWQVQPYMFSFSSSCLVQNLWIESPGMFNLSVLHVWLKIWMESPCIFNLSVSKLGWNHPVCSSCLVQNF
jgi:hypothetical protein